MPFVTGGVGAPGAAFTVIAIVATLESEAPSFALKLTLSGPV
jgi:hypothetical protein